MLIIKKIKNLFFKRKIFLIADTHFDHKNIIKHCHRPFKSVNHMNAILLKNWNNVVGKKDIVYFLGDFTRKGPRIGYWLKRLNGTIIFISGNHDKRLKRRYFKKILKYKNKEFLLIHDPKDLPKNWKGWVIHGHKHNNDMKVYPFINCKNKTINVGCELISYSPLQIDLLFKKDLDNMPLSTRFNYKKDLLK